MNLFCDLGNELSEWLTFYFKMKRHVCLGNGWTDAMHLKCRNWTQIHFEIRNNSIEHWTVISDRAQLFQKIL